MLRRSGLRRLGDRSGVWQSRQSCGTRCSSCVLPTASHVAPPPLSYAGASRAICRHAAAALHETRRCMSDVTESSEASPLPRFKPPETMSHHGLAYATCPVCSQVIHMSRMLSHLLAAHPEHSAAYWVRLCRSRVRMYERVTGGSLKDGEGMPVDLVGGIDSGTADTSPMADEVRACLPTISDTGTYTCNWCSIRSAPLPSRDSFLLHVAKEHPTLDFDLVEALVPQPPASAEQRRTHAGDDAMEASDTSDGGVDASGESAWGLGTPALVRPSTRPTYRMPGVRVVEESNVVTVKAAPRQRGTSVGRVTLRKDEVPAAAAAPLRPAEEIDMDSATGIYFAENHFPCELCMRVFTSELNLLQHLEGKHRPVVAEAAASEATTTAAAASPVVASPAPAAAPPTTPEAPFSVFCDRCTTPSKAFRSPSALFSHIRFRHPAEDATYEMERMIEEQRQRPPVTCPHCHQHFQDVDRMERHVREVHGAVNRPTAPSAVVGQATLGSLVPPSPNTTSDKAASSLIHSKLLPVTVRTRFWCNECEKGFPSACALYAHSDSKHTVVARTYPCPACRRSFRDAPSLELHIRSAHAPLTMKDFGLVVSVECPDCQRHFMDPIHLHNHAVRHHGKSSIAPPRSFQGPGEDEAGSAAAAGGAAASASQLSADASGGAAAPATPPAPAGPRKVVRRKRRESASTAEA
ncbi:mitochondrial RNA binding protein 1 [Novymonas esmeraldas]|uniref:Mitochondrial RNA binding protein 1 n=1 Tax=Novymonas esmeraldas TaxID=1808958 RepID=A0AAW0F3B1_9TRYP